MADKINFHGLCCKTASFTGPHDWLLGKKKKPSYRCKISFKHRMLGKKIEPNEILGILVADKHQWFVKCNTETAWTECQVINWIHKMKSWTPGCIIKHTPVAKFGSNKKVRNVKQENTCLLQGRSQNALGNNKCSSTLTLHFSPIP